MIWNTSSAHTNTQNREVGEVRGRKVCSAFSLSFFLLPSLSLALSTLCIASGMLTHAHAHTHSHIHPHTYTHSSRATREREREREEERKREREKERERKGRRKKRERKKEREREGERVAKLFCLT